MRKTIFLLLNSLKLTCQLILYRPAPYVSAFFGFLMTMAVAAIVLGMFNGLQDTMRESGSDLVAVIESEHGGGISEEVVRYMYQTDAVEKSINGPALMRAFNTPIQVMLDGRNQVASVGFLGVEPSFQYIWKNIHVRDGRTFTPGTNEVIVGRRLFEVSPSVFSVGKNIEWNNQLWTVVGIFESNGDRRESQIVGDQINLRAAHNQQLYTGIYARIINATAIDEIKNFLQKRYGAGISVNSERDLLKNTGAGIRLIILIIGAFTVAVISIGAVIGGINIISIMVSDRAKDIGVMKALGFENSFVFLGVIFESLLVSLSGAVAAFFLARAFMHGEIISTSSSGVFFSFDFNFDSSVFLHVVLFGFVLGLAGGLIPAIRATSIRAAEAFRA